MRTPRRWVDGRCGRRPALAGALTARFHGFDLRRTTAARRTCRVCRAKSSLRARTVPLRREHDRIHGGRRAFRARPTVRRPIVLGVLQEPQARAGRSRRPAAARVRCRPTTTGWSRSGARDRAAVRRREHHADAGRQGTDQGQLRVEPIERLQQDQGRGGGHQLTSTRHVAGRQRTPFAAERGWVRDRNGAEVWLVAVKCTFDIGPDGSDRVVRGAATGASVPEYHGEPGKSSIKYEADLVLTKTTTDVIVVGHAYAPGGRAVTRWRSAFASARCRKCCACSVTGRGASRALGAGAVREDAARLRARLRRCRSAVGEPGAGLGLA